MQGDHIDKESRTSTGEEQGYVLSEEASPGHRNGNTAILDF